MAFSASPAAPTGLTIRVTARLFAQYLELTGADTEVLDLPSGSTVADAVAALRSRLANGHLLPDRPLVAVNLRHALLDQVLADGDELALLPPLAGG